ncbi:MAG: response regulator transcription factor [Helicobacteraceae bacterium]|jgi:DNA-binding response OmpR family regulator|nr:response regulator transcription factor [Helicobacteraceae bacterium]
MSKILIIDDDDHIRELVGALLKREGFYICEAIDGERALEEINDAKIDLYIIDIMMPKMDGFELCRYIREYREETPILMLTAKAEIAQKIKGFERGADDYLTKPFEPQELILRVKALLKRYKIITSQSVSIGSLLIDKNSYSISLNGKKSDIPPKEFELLFKLSAGEGKTFTRSALIEDIWGYDFEGNERTLDVHINRLRERFSADQYGFRITTIRGLGYRLETLK